MGLNSSIIVEVVLGYLAFLVILALVWAVVLRVFAGWSQIPAPRYGRAVLIMLVAVFASFAASILIGIVLFAGMYFLDADVPEMVVTVLNLIVTVLAIGGVITVLLPTTFGKGMLISFRIVLFSAVVVALIAALVRFWSF